MRLDVAAEEARLDALQAADGCDPVTRVRGRAHRALPVRAHAELRRGGRERASAGNELHRRVRERVGPRLELVRRLREPHPADVEPPDRRPRREPRRRTREEREGHEREQGDEADQEDGPAHRDRRERRRRAIPETLVAPDDTNGNVADPHTPSVPRNGVDPGPLTQCAGDVAGPVVEPSSETDRHGRAAGPPRFRHRLAPRHAPRIPSKRHRRSWRSTRPMPPRCSSTWARTDGFEMAWLEQALYDERTLVRILGMRRTLWVVTDELAPIVDAACTRTVAARERTRLKQINPQSDLAEDPAVWIDRVAAAALDALRDRDEAFTSDLTRADPLLATKIRLGAGTRWEAHVSAGSRILPLLAAQGRIVRGRPPRRLDARPVPLGARTGSGRRAGYDLPGRAAPPLARVVRAGDRDRRPLVDRLDCARGARSARGRSSRRRRPGRVIRARPRGRPRARPAARAVGVPPADPRPDDDGLEGTGLVPRPACRAALRPERERRPDRLVERPRRRRGRSGRMGRSSSASSRTSARRPSRPSRQRPSGSPRGSGTSGSRRDSFPRSSARSPADLGPAGFATATAGAFRDLPRRRRGSKRRESAPAEPARERPSGGLRPRQRAPSGSAPPQAGIQAAGIRSCGTRSRTTKRGLATATAGAFRDCPAAGGDPSGGIPSCGFPLANEKRGLATATAGAFRDLPRRRRGSERRNPLLRIPAEQAEPRTYLLPPSSAAGSATCPRRSGRASRRA